MNERNMSKFMGQAVNDYAMIQDGDRIVVGISGGADSLALISLLSFRKERIPIDYTLLPVMVDTFGGENPAHQENILQIKEFIAQKCDLSLTVISLPIVEYLKDKKKSVCFKCAQIRRSELIKFADQNACSKIALGHHKDDVVETLLLNMLYKRELSAMMPRLPLFDGKMELIRPLIYIEKRQIEHYIGMINAPVLNKQEAESACPAKTNQDKEGFSRETVQALLKLMAEKVPSAKNNLFAAFRNPKSDYLLDRFFSPQSAGVHKRP